jgi:hypothetical protein
VLIIDYFASPAEGQFAAARRTMSDM